jgi:hypothetical protein
VKIRAEQAELRAAHAALRMAAVRLRALALRARAEAIAEAVRLLLDPLAPLGRELRQGLLGSTGLSAPVIEHGLRTTLCVFQRDALLALHQTRPAERGAELAVVVLAGNVFSAAARPLLLPLLCGASVLAKASSADDVLPRCLERALAAVDRDLAQACGIVTFAHGETALEGALLHDADLVCAYGNDTTLAALLPRVTAKTRWLGHGHGRGAIYLSADALASQAIASELAHRAALDIAAYDQRGCLSPHEVLVQRGAEVSAARFARLLAAALRDVQRELPRGELPADAASAQLAWRGVAAAVFELHHDASWAVSYEGEALLRPSPGYRNIAVHDCADLAALRARLTPLGNRLKALGVAGDSVMRELSSLAPYVCEVGAMQAPPLQATLDGLHPLAGLG